MNFRFLQEPAAHDLQRYSANIRSALLRMKESAERGPATAIKTIFVTTGCDHACRFCLANAVPLSKGKFIGMDTIDLAHQKLGFVTPVDLTGGEPLDHPEIVAIARRTMGGIPFTNGFSRAIALDESKEVVDAIGERIGGVSFSVHDRGDNPGRFVVLKHLLLSGQTPKMKFILEPGKERDLFNAWLGTLFSLLEDPEIRGSFRERHVAAAFSQLFAVQTSYCSMSLVAKSGRGSNLEGIDMNRMSITPFMYDYSNVVDRTVLLPDGGLAPEFLVCYYSRDARTLAFANIHDPIETINSRFRSMLLDHIERRLDRSEAEFHDEVRTHYEFQDFMTRITVEFMSLFKDPDIRAKLKDLKSEIAGILGIPPSLIIGLSDVRPGDFDVFIQERIDMTYGKLDYLRGLF